MSSLIMGLLAETSIHPGVGRNLGAIDLPVAREAATDYPVLVGSGLKGALRDQARRANRDHQRLFGRQDDAGQLLISDARILLLPVRSLTGQYRWVTCPHILERFARDRRRARLVGPTVTASVASGQALAADPAGTPLFLEERQFKTAGPCPDEIITHVKEIVGDDQCGARGRIAGQLVVLSDDDFAWFARYGLPVQARNVLDETKKTSKNLWYEETLPPDTLMYALISERHEGGSLTDFREMFAKRPYVQAGGNETIGQGIFLVSLAPAQATQNHAVEGG